MSLRTVDGRDIPLDELPTAKALRSGDTVLADEVVIHLPNGRAISTLVNARPIYREDGEAISVVATIPPDRCRCPPLDSCATSFPVSRSNLLRRASTATSVTDLTRLSGKVQEGPGRLCR